MLAALNTTTVSCDWGDSAALTFPGTYQGTSGKARIRPCSASKLAGQDSTTVLCPSQHCSQRLNFSHPKTITARHSKAQPVHHGRESLRQHQDTHHEEGPRTLTTTLSPQLQSPKNISTCARLGWRQASQRSKERSESRVQP